MNESKQPKALRVAEKCRQARIDPECPFFVSVALSDAELVIREQHDRISELEANEYSIGAGGVGLEPLRKREQEDCSRCTGCGGTGFVDDGELTGSGGVPFECGPVKCVKDCPDCTPSANAQEASRECLHAVQEPARGQSGFEAWWRDKYPAFAMRAPDVWEAAMHHAAQPSRECLQQSAKRIEIDQQKQNELMRKAGIWIEHSTLFEDDLPARELKAVQAEKHQLDMYTKLVAECAALQAAPQAHTTYIGQQGQALAAQRGAA